MNKISNGVYIFHETLGVKTVEGWNPKDNEGVIGVLVVEDDHKIVLALEDSPNNLYWSEERKSINFLESFRPVVRPEEKESDFNGEEYCKNLNSPDFPAVYYCLNYKKGGRNWYLPSTGELWLIYRHLEEIQTVLSIVGGQRLVTDYDNDVPCYWSSTEFSALYAKYLDIYNKFLGVCGHKVRYTFKVRPVSKIKI